ncbi:MAG: hypothetical protein FWF32_02805, partial [Endomicrobia bacterium]|nr:hypothetical protein [Endomicrobiia bacterium]
DTKVMLIGDSNLRIEKAEVIAKPVTKAAIAEFLKPAVKGKIAIISSDTLKSNNLKLSILAKGYDVIYFPLMDKFLNSAELNTFNVIISETGIITELENLCRKVNSGDISGQLIGILDYEIPIPENMINKKIKFLQNPFELSELFKIIEE